MPVNSHQSPVISEKFEREFKEHAFAQTPGEVEKAMTTAYQVGFDDLIAALQEINRIAAGDGEVIWFPELIKQADADLDGFQRQPCESKLFEYEYCCQNGGGITGDSFYGDMMYPIRDWFIKVHYNI